MIALTSINALQTLGSSSGRTYALNNFAPVMFGCAHVSLVCTATVGNRQIVARLMDAAGNIFYEGIAGNVAASGSGLLSYGAGMTTVTTSFVQAISAPDFALPPKSQIQVLDVANIDVNDTIAVNVAMLIP